MRLQPSIVVAGRGEPSPRSDHDRSDSYSSEASDNLYDYLSTRPSSSSSQQPQLHIQSTPCQHDPASISTVDPSAAASHSPSPYSTTPSDRASSSAFSSLPWARQSTSSVEDQLFDQALYDLDAEGDDETGPAPFEPSIVGRTRTKSKMPLFSSFAAMLAPSSTSSNSTPIPASPDMCFCGKPADVEEDSIYCSVECGRRDSMSALCGGAEQVASGAVEGSSSSTHSRSSASSIASSSHYRRVGIEESRREKERQKEKDRERARDKARLGAWRFGGGGSSSSTSPSIASPSPTPSYTSTTSHSSSRRQSRALGPRSESTSSHASVPSLSSSVASYATSESSLSSSLSSPPSPYFPSTPPSSSSAQLFPVSPQPTLCPPSNEDIYNNYLGNLTPTLASLSPPASPFKKLSMGAGSSEPGVVGLGYILDEESDRVTSGIGWGGHQLKERVKGRMPKGHQKGKLSFEDVVGIMGSKC
ncbi:hypothetical protein T439DRAFT_325027 [Meredithblackwellia eburnea MCA 4105]